MGSNAMQSATSASILGGGNGDDGAGDAAGAGAAASGDPYIAGAQAAGEGAKFLYGVYKDEQAGRQTKEDKRAQEQNSMRGEATYRQNRALLMDQIAHFYAKRGWDLPETNFPGQGTSRPIPGDKNPYAGYDVDPSYETHQPVDANGTPIQFDKNDPNSTVNPNETVRQAMAKPSEAEQAIQNSGPNLEQAKIAAAQFKPVNQAKALRANLMAQSAGGTAAPIQVEDPAAQSQASAEAPQFVKFNNQAKTAMPLTNVLGNTGRRQYGY